MRNSTETGLRVTGRSTEEPSDPVGQKFGIWFLSMPESIMRWRSLCLAVCVRPRPPKTTGQRGHLVLGSDENLAFVLVESKMAPFVMGNGLVFEMYVWPFLLPVCLHFITFALREQRSKSEQSEFL